MDEPTVDPARAVVPAELDGIRADRVVAVVFDLTRATARSIVDAGLVTVDGAPAVASQRLIAGGVIEAELPVVDEELVPAPVPFMVSYEDDALIVVDKPAGVVTHPGAGVSEPTLVAGLVHRFPDLLTLTDNRWGLVHRLDRDTSGLLAVARSTEAHTRLQEAMRRRQITRTYLTLVAGVPDGARGTVDAPIGRDPRHPTRRAVTGEGRPARTHYRRLAEWGDVALLEVTLETGRTHQIRVHLASIGNPVVGDRVYRGGAGGSSPSPGRSVADPGRQWLHATRLELDHPVDGRRIVTSSSLPSDLAASLGALGAPLTGTTPEDG